MTTTVGPFSPIEYVQWYLSSSQSTILNTQAYLDNSNNDWDDTQANGNTVAVQSDSTTNTITFFHANYVGSELNSTITPSEDLHPEQAAALGIDAGDSTSWNLIIIGVAMIIGGVALAFFTVGLGSIVAATIVTAGVGLVLAGATIAVFSPSLQSQTCNDTSTSCCYDYTSASSGLISTCNTCSGSTCNSTTTQTGGLTGFFDSFGGALIAIAAVAVAIVILYFVLMYAWRHRKDRKSKTPATPPEGATR